MMAGHTPQRWRVIDDRGRYEVIGPGSVTVAVVYHTPDGRAADSAFLIAAAPDLLTAAADLLTLLVEVAPEYAESTVAANARAAIAKASPRTEETS